jgi:hypothetical protein
MHFKSYLYFSLAVIFIAASCNQSPKVVPTYLRVDKALFFNKLTDKPAIYFSCIRCGCMVDALNELQERWPKLLQKFDFFADTSCVKQLHFKQLVQHSPQLFLDSVYDENYSVMVFKSQADSVEARLIKTEEVLQMKDILEKY